MQTDQSSKTKNFPLPVLEKGHYSFIVHSNMRKVETTKSAYSETNECTDRSNRTKGLDMTTL
jgi:hypothetical protein